VAVILIDFDDGVMRDGPAVAQRFRDLFFLTAPGTVSHYYAEVSQNSITRFEGAVVGPFRMPHSRSYYANNSYGRGGTSPNARDMASDAYDAAIDALGDLKKYDNDDNGFVDAFIVVHAGRGAEQTRKVQDIWSLKWQLPFDRSDHGATVSGFLTVPEDARLGVCVHELGHLVFGWPDLYDSKPNPTGEGVGDWCLMSSGSWGGSPVGSKPVHPSAWCKASQGWVDIDTVTFDRILDIQEVKTSYMVHRLWRQGQANTDEYYLAENRTMTQYDESLPAQGLLSMCLPFIFAKCPN
jgi:immune inhibitor A